jgi:TolB-like protein/class 3 adenylate cyclase
LSSEHVERRLAAILAADVAGSCRLIGIDEEGTLAQLKALRRTLFDPKITERRGRVVKNTGDGALVEFGSVVDAVRCAVEIQRGMAEHNIDIPEVKRIDFRIGIHVGDIIIEDHDIFGDGVNIAARLEGIAEPGGVCMSDDAYRQVRGKVEITCDDMGQQSLKNIADPIRTWRVRLTGQTPSAVNSGSAVSQPRVLPLPDKPSIAVLPFQNMSGDPEQEYFADGMVEEIITSLSRSKFLFVIARNSSFTYKGKAVDIKRVGRELGVRYVLEGSVRKAGSRVRITGQLVDTTTGAHLWADKFEGELQNVFDLQDNVATSVVGAIFPRLFDAEVELVKRKPPESWASYDFWLRGISLYRQRTPDTMEQALVLFRKAIDLDQEFAMAHAAAAACIFTRAVVGVWLVTDEERSEAVQLTTRALALAGDEPYVLAWAGLIFAYWNDELERGSDLADRALAINPNWSGGWNVRGAISLTLGDGARALDAFDRVIRLDPADDGEVLDAMRGKLYAFSLLERYSDALGMSDRVLARRPNDLRAWFFKYVRDPDPARAADAADHIRALYPHLRGSVLRAILGVTKIRDPKRRAFTENAIAGLGLPE